MQNSMSELLKNTNILITGANGFIGKSLCNKLNYLGANIIAVINKKNDLSFPIQKIHYDGTYKSLSVPLENKKIDIVIHLATCFISNHKSEQINELIDSNVKFGTYILELTKQKGIPYFINTSTYAQFLDHKEYNPQNLYTATKQAFEAIIKYYEETTPNLYVTLELTDTYGPDDERPKFINLVLDAIKKNNVFNMSLGEQEICYLYIDDAVNAYIKCIELLINGSVKENSKYSIYSEEIFKLKDLVTEVCRILNVELETNKGFYSYRDREIMTFEPTYQKLPDWNSKVSLKDGILNLKTNN